jgi:hypothetical protein
VAELDLVRPMRCLLLTAVALPLVLEISAAKESPVISLSSEPTGLTVKSKSGEQIIPGIDIYSDGRVAIRRYDGSEATKRLAKDAIQKLLDRLERTRFYNITEESFDAEFYASQRPREVDGTFTTTSRIFITDCPIWTLQILHAGVRRSTKF